MITASPRQIYAATMLYHYDTAMSLFKMGSRDMYPKVRAEATYVYGHNRLRTLRHALETGGPREWIEEERECWPGLGANILFKADRVVGFDYDVEAEISKRERKLERMLDRVLV